MKDSKKMIQPRDITTTKGSAVSLKPPRPTPPASNPKPSNNPKQGKSNGQK